MSFLYVAILRYLLITSSLALKVLNEYFHNVCELDLVFNFYKVGSQITSTMTDCCCTRCSCSVKLD